jgi:hypothetical protein
MEAKARVTLNDPALHSRLRREFAKPSYSKRPIRRLQTTLLSDVIVRQQQSTERNISTPVRRSITFESRTTPRTEFADQSTKFRLKNINATVSSASLQTVTQAVAPNTAHKKTRNKLQIALFVLAVCLVVAGGFISYQGIRDNHLVALQAAKLTQQANEAAQSQLLASQSATGIKSNSTKNLTPVLSTVKPTTNALADYVVAPNLPRYIIIPKLNVDARVLSVGVNANGALGTPDNVYDTAWYNESAQPGQPGAMLIDGHVSSWTAHGVFYGIKTLTPGDIIKIQRGDGTVFTYNVVRSQIFQSSNVDMTSAMTPVVTGQPGLNLITCTGDVIPGTNEFNERIVVYATLE